jgi:hypothetical protein
VQHDVCARNDIPTEEFAGRLGEKVFEEGTVLLQLRVNVRSLYFTSNTPSDRLDEEGNRSVLDVYDRENREDLTDIETYSG